MHIGLKFFSWAFSLPIMMLVFYFPVSTIASDVGVVEFSADLVHQIPTQEAVVGKLYVTKDKIRREEGSGEKSRITIEDFSANKAFVLNPARKEYVEIPRPSAQSDRSRSSAKRPLPGDADHLCANHAQFRCKLLSKNERIADRLVEKWEIVREMQIKEQGTQTMRALVWVDRKLGANVREERFINGDAVGSSEFRAIREAPQDKSLFKVPMDYRRIEMPKQSFGTPPNNN